MYRECRHIKVSGGKCKAAALKGKDYCYFHSAQRRRAARPSSEKWYLDIPFLEDRSTIQLAISEVADALANSRIEQKRAGLLLYALQIASHNAKGAEIVSDKPVRETTLSVGGEELGPLVKNTSEDFTRLIADSLAEKCVDRFLNQNSSHAAVDSTGQDEDDDDDDEDAELDDTDGELKTTHQDQNEIPDSLHALDANDENLDDTEECLEPESAA